MGQVATDGAMGRLKSHFIMLRMSRQALTGGLVAACVAGALAHPAAAAGLHVIPFPRTPDASPLTRIIFASLRPRDFDRVMVIGSVSGPHRGQLKRLPDDAGMTFVPQRPFAPGERVQVTAEFRSSAAAAALGVPAARRVRFWFRIGLSVRPAPAVRQPRARSAAAEAGPWDGMRFHSEPGLHPPTVLTAAGDTDPDDIFVTPRNSYQRRVNIQQGPMILNGRGQLIWFRDIPQGLASNLQVQSYRNQPVLTWWQAPQPPGGLPDLRASEDLIVDRSYRTLAALRAGNGYTTDPHDLQLTPRGTALISTIALAKADLTPFGGPAHGYVLDCIIQELDIKTGQVLWEWHSYGHVPLSASYFKPGPGSFDYFHLNSFQELTDGNIVISARHTCAIYEINKSSGKIIWKLGGKDSDFKLGQGARFWWQHDARLSGNTLSLFDDGSDGPTAEETESSAKVLRLDTQTMTATLVHRYTHEPALLAISQGSVQTLPNGNVFVGWGSDPQFSEYTPQGRATFEASFALGVNTYRAYRFPWIGRPTTRPALALTPSSTGRMVLYASWNGATGIARWRVLGGPGPHSLSWVANAVRVGFETKIRIRTSPRYVVVQALDSTGNVIGTSAPIRNPS